MPENPTSQECLACGGELTAPAPGWGGSLARAPPDESHGVHPGKRSRDFEHFNNHPASQSCIICGAAMLRAAVGPLHERPAQPRVVSGLPTPIPEGADVPTVS